MLSKTMMQKIQDLKLQGYTKGDIPGYFISRGLKPPSAPTIKKYYDMDVIPENPGANLEKPKLFDAEPFRSVIIEVLRNNADNKHFTVSSMYDVLEEIFVENGDYDALPGSQQTLRNYVHYLQDHGIVETEPKNTRIYDHVFDTDPGEQMLIDFGELEPTKGFRVHFICLLLIYSRFLIVYAQDHKFNAEEACNAIYRSFCRLGGRPSVLVIDQDAVFVASETYGEVIETRVFNDFCTEQDLKLWVCHKADPESKGSVENAVGFVKKNFFAARKIECIDDVWRSLPGWLDRKNRRIHQATYCVPLNIFNDTEKEALRPLVPSFYENSPNSFISCEISGYPFIKYRSNQYSVPQSCCFRTVYYKVVGTKMHVYDESRRFVCTHTISECRGRKIQLDEHKHKESEAWIPIVERMRTKWNCVDFQHFVNGVKKENPRYIAEQFTQIEAFFDQQHADRATVAVVMKICCEKWRYRFSQIRIVYQDVVNGKIPEAANISSEVQKQDLSVYQKAFNQRCGIGSEAVS